MTRTNRPTSPARYTVAAALLATVVANSQSNPIGGNWAGVMGSGSAEVGLRIRIESDGEHARFTVPHFGWYDLRAPVERRGSVYHLRLGVYRHVARVELRIQDGSLRGTMRGWGQSGPVRLARATPTYWPVSAEELNFTNQGHTLRGTLVMPRGDGPFPAIVWTHGSGRVTRENPIYRSLAFWVAEHGIASLIYDKRPPLPGATMQVLGADAVAGVDALRADARILTNAVGVGGLSQGGWVSPIAAAASDRVAFVVALSAPGISPAEQNLFNQRNKVLNAGFGTDAADEASRILRSIYGYLRTGKRRDEVWEELGRSRSKPWFQAAYELPIWRRRGLPKAPWEHRAALDFDPATVWNKVKVPVVGVWGANDNVVPGEKSRAAIHGWLDRAGNTKRLLTVIPSCSHDLRLPATEPWELGAIPARLNAIPRFVHSLVAKPIAIPKTKRGNAAYELHGTRVPDPFRWLETPGKERDAWARAQGEATARSYAGDAMVESLRKRIIELNSYTRAPVPRVVGERWFSLRRGAGGLHGRIHVHTARQWNDAAPGRVLVDALQHPASPEHPMAIGHPIPSPNGEYVLYGASSKTVAHCLRVVDVASGSDRAGDSVGIRYWTWRVSWLADSSGYAYVDGNAVRVHKLGTRTDEDKTLFRTTDKPAPHLAVRAAVDGSMLFVTAFHRNDSTTKVHTIELAPDAAPVQLIAKPEAEYQVLGKRGNRVFVYTTRTAPNGRVIAVDLAHPQPDRWTEIIPEYEAAVMDGNHPIRPAAGLFGDRLVVLYIHDGKMLLRTHDLAGKLLHEVSHPGFNESGLVGQPRDSMVQYDVQSMFNPGSAHVLDLRTGKTALLGKPRVPFDPTEFESYRRTYTSHDGTDIPIFLAHRKGLVRDGSHAVMIRNYGISGIVPRPMYLPELHAWVEAGGVLALPSVRASGEFGKAWHRAGSGTNKVVSLDDLKAAADWLAQSGYSRADRIALTGSSAIGAATAATLVRHPDSFGAGLLPIPRIDLLATKRLVEEYGDYDDERHFRAMMQWMPLVNTKRHVYPPILIQVGSVDRVTRPFHGYKMAATLQAAQIGNAPIHLQVVWGVGHAQGIGIPHRSATLAAQLGFLARTLRL